jgi:hypothetical protein
VSSAWARWHVGGQQLASLIVREMDDCPPYPHMQSSPSDLLALFREASQYKNSTPTPELPFAKSFDSTCETRPAKTLSDGSVPVILFGILKSTRTGSPTNIGWLVTK